MSNEIIHDDIDRSAAFQAPVREWNGVKLHPLSVAREVYFQRLRKEHGEDDTVASTIILLWLLCHRADEISMLSKDSTKALGQIWLWSEDNVPQSKVLEAIELTTEIISEAYASVVEEVSDSPLAEKKSGRQSLAGRPGSSPESQS